MTDLGTRALVLACGAALDLILGDPRKLWHPVIGFGWLISRFETLLFRIFRLSGEPEADRGRKRAAGALLTVLVLTVAAAAYFALRFLLGLTGPALPLLLDVIVTWQMLAMASCSGRYGSGEKGGLDGGGAGHRLPDRGRHHEGSG